MRKELKVKYKRSVLGFMWSLIMPVALAGIYLFVFGYVYEVAQDDFILFLLSGLLPWNYFSMSLTAATDSLIRNAPMIRKVYFPRELIPLSVIGANLITFLAGFGLLFIVILLTGRPAYLHIHWMLLAILLQTLVSVGAAGALSVWNVYFRDIAQLMTIFMIVLFFGTPIVYELAKVPEAFRPLVLANPLTSIMEIYRAALIRAEPPRLDLVGLALIETLVILAFGMFVFRRNSPRLPKEL